ncbi:MAG: hydroxymethylglutaryl-CoA lyase, partial [Firmicutes bacterium HGW-Firmicutes-18]
MEKSKRITISEIAPRDGFQSVKEWIDTDLKLEIIDRIVDSGVKRIQITSFVNAKAIPQMKDAVELTQRVIEKYNDLSLFALVPNYHGVQTAFKSKINEVSYVISVSESHNKANVNKTIIESIEELKRIRNDFPNMIINLDAATSFGCPFEGETPLENTMDLVKKAIEIGVDSVDICDTIGVAYPKQVEILTKMLLKEFLNTKFEIHIHDTRNMGILNTFTALQNGITSVQTSLGGLGGCPFAPGASGNTSTEDLIYMLTKNGFETDIDFNKILSAAKFLRKNVEGNYSGHHINIEASYRE